MFIERFIPWFLQSAFGTGIAYSKPVDTTFLTLSEAPQKGAAQKPQPTPSGRSLTAKLPSVPFWGVVLWLVVGFFISWQVADFNLTLAPDKPTLPAWLVFALFLVSSFGVLLVWRFRQKAGKQAGQPV